MDKSQYITNIAWNISYWILICYFYFLPFSVKTKICITINTWNAKKISTLRGLKFEKVFQFCFFFGMFIRTVEAPSNKWSWIGKSWLKDKQRICFLVSISLSRKDPNLDTLVHSCRFIQLCTLLRVRQNTLNRKSYK